MEKWKKENDMLTGQTVSEKIWILKLVMIARAATVAVYRNQ